MARTFAGLAAAAALLCATALGASGVASAAEVTLKAVSAFPKTLNFTQSFLRYVDKVNAAGKGVVQITYVGGPEAIPVTEQPTALRNGVFDIHYGPTGYYAGQFPEGDALFGSNMTPWEIRETGGMQMLADAFETRMSAHLLGWFDGGISVALYLREAPARTADGGIDLSGKKMRAAPSYRELMSSLGATNVMIQAPEIYTSLERGLVDGVVWPVVGAPDLGWHKFVKYRVEPTVNQVEIVALVNLAKWNGLSKEAQDILTKAAIEHERESYAFFQDLQKSERQMLIDGGIEIIELQGAAADAYVDTAVNSAWKRLDERAPAFAAEAKDKFVH